ncbi:glucosyl-3-phosphoglycerate synthase [Solirubrobacter ginsenosidimutans]|uniref:4,4'-diaponeurosporenoate glycosyltransferase n=1 Tax=Solirubrobacter ginsenosidimutans TaxID=490573 RepID=A0A9X3S3Y6_9ACTN|nr:glucosyl-3-phosphoglycerate synthase [Solirubrobacter ginsenosidimutans]MDA0162586.1 glucosyl-3-phosphoglycerate synthase [Solirubrobacter ginsenosidimutans]
MRACVVVPARDEEELIGACIAALAGQRGVAREDYAVLLVLDRCTDATEQRAREAAGTLNLQIIEAQESGVGHARRQGMDLAAGLLEPDGLIATTDADSEPAPDWLRAQLDAVAGGARAIGGRILLGAHDLPPAALRRREADAAIRQAALVGAGAREHHQFSGASLAVTAATYAKVGRMEPRAALEDEGFERALRRHGVPIERLAAVRVTTSGRRFGRTQRGLAVDLRRNSWLAERNYRASEFSHDELRAVKDRRVSVILPTREVASTLPHILDALEPLHDLIDELLVVDADSADGTAEIAHERGVWVQSESALQRQFGPALGKGDAMWRALSATTGELVCFLDTDTEDFDASFLRGMLGPLLTNPELAFVKGHFRRPFRIGDTTHPHGGGRVTELLARPYLNLHFPELAGFRQPLAGELAATRTLLEQLPFPVGYGVEIANLIDAHRLVGLERMAQVDLGTRQNRHQPLQALSRMALEVLAAAERRTHATDAVPGPLLVPTADDFEVRAALTDERPPLVTMH